MGNLPVGLGRTTLRNGLAKSEAEGDDALDRNEQFVSCNNKH
jgi:hypothetical protein